MRGGGGN